MADLIQARPTTYNGIRMRSRLEANFAQLYLDRKFPDRWIYEPECFASKDGQYLPDFWVDGVYVEVKPAMAVVCEGNPGPNSAGVDTSRMDPFLQKMEIIWATHPRAFFWLVLWKYNVGQEGAICAAGDDRVWWWLHQGEWALWPGLGQLEAVVRYRKRQGRSG